MTWLIDGVDLVDAGIARYVMRRPGLQRTAPIRGSNQPIAGRPGAAWSPKLADEGSVLLTIGLRGADAASWEGSFNDLLAMLGSRHRQLALHRVRPDGGHRYAAGELLAAIEPQMLGPAAGMCALDFDLPFPYWHDSSTGTDLTSPTVDTGYTATSAMTAVTTNVFDFTFGSFAAGSAPSAPNYTPVAWIRGPITGAWSVRNTETGETFTISQALTDGEVWTVETDTFALTRQVAGSGGPLGALDPTLMTYTAGKPFTLESKAAGGSHTLRLTTSGGQGANTALRVTGRRWYATA